jgi:hypothetical protein
VSDAVAGSDTRARVTGALRATFFVSPITIGRASRVFGAATGAAVRAQFAGWS